MPVYLDCNATTPMEPAVRDAMLDYLGDEFGNAGSRTHEYGNRAKEAIQRARDQVAAVVGAQRDEVIFTSGATESNNLAILGLAGGPSGDRRKHIISTEIEHKAVLEPLEELARRGFDVQLLPPTRGGWVDPDRVRSALRADTLLVSVMHVNNETGVIQPIPKIAQALAQHDAYFHVDASQGYGKESSALRDARIDLVSVSAHKVYGPKGIGALIARRRRFERPPLRPLLFGGGQERGLRPGTLPVPQIVGFGVASDLALRNASVRRTRCEAFRAAALREMAFLGVEMNGDSGCVVPHTLNLVLPGLDSEAVIVALKDLIAISNGSACTSQRYEPSHVLKAMGLSDEAIRGAIRLSWCHMTEDVDWGGIVRRLRGLMR